jgi:hypothetical protein
MTYRARERVQVARLLRDACAAGLSVSVDESTGILRMSGPRSAVPLARRVKALEYAIIHLLAVEALNEGLDGVQVIDYY